MLLLQLRWGVEEQCEAVRLGLVKMRIGLALVPSRLPRFHVAVLVLVVVVVLVADQTALHQTRNPWNTEPHYWKGRDFHCTVCCLHGFPMAVPSNRSHSTRLFLSTLNKPNPHTHKTYDTLSLHPQQSPSARLQSPESFRNSLGGFPPGLQFHTVETRPIVLLLSDLLKEREGTGHTP